MKTAYQGITHKDPKTNHLVWRVAKNVYKERLHVYTGDRAGNAKVKAVPDILALGEAKLKSSSLSTFNRKIRTMIEGGEFDEESDLLPSMSLSFNPEDNDDSGEALDEAHETVVELE